MGALLHDSSLQKRFFSGKTGKTQNATPCRTVNIAIYEYIHYFSKILVYFRVLSSKIPYIFPFFDYPDINRYIYILNLYQSIFIYI